MRISSPLAVGLLRASLGALFLWAAIAKAADPALFAEEIGRYRLVPDALAPPIAWCVIVAELLAGGALVLGLARRTAVWASAAMLAVFTAALAQALIRHLDLSCGCFGGSEPATWWTVARDLLLLAVCAVLLRSGAPGAGRSTGRGAGV